MPDLRQTRKKITTVLVVMAALDVLALVVYASPLVGSTEARKQTINRLQLELTLKTRQVAPLKNLAGPDGKVQLAKHEIADFYKKRIPEQESEIVAEFGRLANENGVAMEQARYKLAEKALGNLQPVELDANLAGNYTALARFINALERDDMFFIINSITLGGEQQGPVKLNLKLEAFLRANS
jgi:type IV pilus assembly protein PilO